MKRMLAVGVGGMAGSLLRAWIYAVIPGTFSLWLINIIGSFLSASP